MRDYRHHHILLSVVCFGLLKSISVDLSLGNAYNYQFSKISIQVYEEENEAQLFASETKESPKTHGFKNPQYYSIRLRESRYELELIHHKLYLDQGLPDWVSHFEVTDGYNLLTANIISPVDKKSFNGVVYYRVGIGTVVAHPDITIHENRYFKRGEGPLPKLWADGYHWGGFSSQLSAFYKKQINKSVSCQLEMKAVYAYTKISLDSIEDTYDRYEVIIPNFSLHLLGGISFGK